MNPGGRPRIYKTPADLATRCLDYFKRSRDAGEPFGIFLLCVHLGFTYVTFLSYERGDNDPKEDGVRSSDKFSYVCIQSRIQIAASSEARLMNGANAAGPIFHLQQISRRLGEQWKNVGSNEVTGPNGKDLQLGPTIVLPDNARGDLYHPPKDRDAG